MSMFFENINNNAYELELISEILTLINLVKLKLLTSTMI